MICSISAVGLNGPIKLGHIYFVHTQNYCTLVCGMGLGHDVKIKYLTLMTVGVEILAQSYKRRENKNSKKIH